MLVGEVDWSRFWDEVQDARRAPTEEELEMELLDRQVEYEMDERDEPYDRFDFVNLVDEENDKY